MDKLTRLDRLCFLIEEAGGRVDGRKKLHKLAYLCERGGTDLGQGFVFYMYGVYSPSLAQDVSAAQAWEYITEESDPAGDKYEISLGSKGREHHSVIPDLEQAGLQLVGNLARESASVLEVVTTIAYLWDSGYREPKLREKLTDLKGHLSFHFEHAFDLVNRYGLCEEARLSTVRTGV